MEYLFKSAKPISITTAGFTFAGGTFTHKALMLTGTTLGAGVTYTIIPLGATFGEGITFCYPSPTGSVNREPYIIPLRVFKITPSANCSVSLLN